MAHADHQRLWRMVEGAVVDALKAHPDYLTAKGRHAAVESITKRVVGQLVGHARQTRKGSGLGRCQAQGPDQQGAAIRSAVTPDPERRGAAIPPGVPAGGGR